MDVILSLHGRVATAIVLYYTLVGLWGLWLGLRGSGPTPSFTGALVIGWLAAMVQGALGLVVFATRAPSQSLHVLYGLALALAIPLAATLVRDRQPRAVSLAYGCMALFAAGLAIRGITTA